MLDEKQKAQDLPFEEALEGLKHIVVALEAGEIPLAELVHQFKKGNELRAICYKHLKEAEFSLEQLKSSPLTTEVI